MPVSPDSVNSDAGKRQAKPLVTIAIPTYNRAQFLRAAIDSALAQNYEPIEVVVSDNASTDETSEIVLSYQDQRLRYIRQDSNIGLIGNWNACLNSARGTYFLVLSDDDRLAPNAIEELVDGIENRDEAGTPSTDIAFAYGYCEIDNKVSDKISTSQFAPVEESTATYQIEYLQGRRICYPSATLFRTEDAKKVGGYNSEYLGGADVVMIFEISCLYPSVFCTRTTTTYYLFHHENYTSSVSANESVVTIHRLAKIAISATDPSGAYYNKVKKIGDLAITRKLLYKSVKEFRDGKIGFNEVALSLVHNRKSLQHIHCVLELLKGSGRFSLPLFTRHQIDLEV